MYHLALGDAIKQAWNVGYRRRRQRTMAASRRSRWSRAAASSPWTRTMSSRPSTPTTGSGCGGSIRARARARPDLWRRRRGRRRPRLRHHRLWRGAGARRGDRQGALAQITERPVRTALATVDRWPRLRRHRRQPAPGRWRPTTARVLWTHNGLPEPAEPPGRGEPGGRGRHRGRALQLGRAVRAPGRERPRAVVRQSRDRAAAWARSTRSPTCAASR